MLDCSIMFSLIQGLSFVGFAFSLSCCRPLSCIWWLMVVSSTSVGDFCRHPCVTDLRNHGCVGFPWGGYGGLPHYSHCGFSVLWTECFEGEMCKVPGWVSLLCRVSTHHCTQHTHQDYSQEGIAAFPLPVPKIIRPSFKTLWKKKYVREAAYQHYWVKRNLFVIRQAKPVLSPR